MNSMLNAFLKSIEKKAFTMARFATRDDDAALDIVQDAMTRLAINYRYKSPEEWPPLFQRILQNRIKDWYRHEHRFQSVFESMEDWLPGSHPEDTKEHGHDEDPFKHLLREGKVEHMMQHIEALPLKQQQVFLLRHWEGYSTAEVAECLNVKEGSVKTHLSRAMTKLRSSLEENYA